MAQLGKVSGEWSLQDLQVICEGTLSVQSGGQNIRYSEMLRGWLINWQNIRNVQQLLSACTQEKVVWVVIETYAKIFQAGCKFENKPSDTPILSQGAIQEALEPQNFDIMGLGDGLLSQNPPLRILSGDGQITITLLNYLVEYLVGKSATISELLKRSLLHALSHLVRSSWFSLDNPGEQIISPILNNFFSFGQAANASSVVLRNLGLKLLYEILDAVTTYSYFLSYLDYRKSMISFQRSTLHRILEVAVNEMKKSFQEGFQTSPNANEAAQLMLKCLSFNFSLSFFEIEIDPEPRDLTIIAVKREKPLKI